MLVEHGSEEPTEGQTAGEMDQRRRGQSGFAVNRVIYQDKGLMGACGFFPNRPAEAGRTSPHCTPFCQRCRATPPTDWERPGRRQTGLDLLRKLLVDVLKEYHLSQYLFVAQYNLPYRFSSNETKNIFIHWKKKIFIYIYIYKKWDKSYC